MRARKLAGLVVAGFIVWQTPAIAEPARFGFMLDAGLPDGANGSIVFRPWQALRFHAGAGFNLVSPGVRAGVTLVPLPTWITPTLTVDVGRYFEGNANQAAQFVSGDPTFSAAVLERVGYDYANAHLGLELGRERMTFYLHAGVSRVLTTIHNVDSQIGDSTLSVSRDVPVRAWSVSARVGLIVYLF